MFSLIPRRRFDESRGESLENWQAQLKTLPVIWRKPLSARGVRDELRTVVAMNPLRWPMQAPQARHPLAVDVLAVLTQQRRDLSVPQTGSHRGHRDGQAFLGLKFLDLSQLHNDLL